MVNFVFDIFPSIIVWWRYVLRMVWRISSRVYGRYLCIVCYRDNGCLMKTMILSPLNSVGAYIDLISLVIYPMHKAGESFVAKDGVHIDDVSPEWTKSLTEDERMTCNLF